MFWTVSSVFKKNTFLLNITVNYINLKLNYEPNIAIELLVPLVFISGCVEFILFISSVLTKCTLLSDPIGVCLDTKLKRVTAATLRMLF
jgi:hypothetical protein